MLPATTIEALKDPARVPVAWHRPFTEEPVWRQFNREGETIFDIVMSVPNLPADFLDRGIVFVNAKEVPQEFWRSVKPKEDIPGRPIMVTLHMPQGGGGGSGGGAKQILGLVASIALLFATAGIAAGALAYTTAAGASWFAAGSISAKILAGAVGLVGALAISALTAPPTPKKPKADDTKSAAGINGNVFDPGGAIPCVIGTRKVFPNLVSEPIVELIGQDEVASAAFILNGPHQMISPKIGDATIEEVDDVLIEMREGWGDDEPLTLFTRQGRTTSPQIQLSEHIVDADTGNILKEVDSTIPPFGGFDSNNPIAKIPRWHSAATRHDPDEIWLHFLLPQGLGRNQGDPISIAFPMRIRIRPRGGDWINLPEIHCDDNVLKQLRKAVILKFDATIPDDPPDPHGGWYTAFVNVPGQEFAPTTEGWTADDYFTSGVNYKPANTVLEQHIVTFYLHGPKFPPAIYDIQVKRGCAYVQTFFNKTTYNYAAFGSDSGIWDFFAYKNTVAPYEIPSTQANVAAQIVFTRIVNIWNEYPILRKGLATIAIQALNRSVDSLSVLASRFVRDWSEADQDWTAWTTSSNPALHYADILCGDFNLDPLPKDLRDNDGLVEWRDLCDTNDWTCDAIVTDLRTQDALLLLASCGYAKPYQADVYGVVVDKDRSAEAPSQVFSARNSRDFSYEKAFARLPDGFIINYSDQDFDYDNAQVIVYRTGYSGGPGGILETITYDGLVDRDKVKTRGLFDLDQGEQRSTFYYISAGAEAIRSKRGDLIGLQTDIILRRSGSAIIKRIAKSATSIVGFDLDGIIPVWNESDMHALVDAHAVLDMHKIGAKTGIAIRRRDGTLSTHELSDATGERDTIMLATPIATADIFWSLDETDGERGSLLIAGTLGTLYKRCLILGISPTKDYGFTMTLVDEAPGMLRAGTTLLTDDDGAHMLDGNGARMMVG